MQWIASNLGRDKPIEKAGVFELKGNELHIHIHHYRECGETWFLNCAVLGINTLELGEISFDEAVEKAKQIIQQRIEFLHNEAFKFVLDGTENERVRY